MSEKPKLIEVQVDARTGQAVLEAALLLADVIDKIAQNHSRQITALALGAAIEGFVETMLRSAPSGPGQQERAHDLLEATLVAGREYALLCLAQNEADKIAKQALAAARGTGSEGGSP